MPVKNTPEKLCSLCIPTYNRAACLRKALESIAQQLAPDSELVISDNGSTDQTREVVREFQQRFAHIRYSSNETNLGYDQNALRCFQLAAGEYVWLLGSDDRLVPGALETVRRRILEAAQRPSLVYLNHSVVDSEGRLLISHQIAIERDREFASASECVRRLEINLGYMSALVLKRDCCVGLAPNQELVGSGWIHLHLALRALHAGRPILYIARPLVLARRSPSVDYDLPERFFRQLAQVFWMARQDSYRWLTIYLTMDRIVRRQYLRFVLAWQCDDRAQLKRAFPILRRTCWIYPAFWLVVLPVRLAPPWLARVVRNALRARRGRRNR